MDIGTSILTEVLCEIFLLLRDKPIALHELENTSHFRDFPWAVGQVCRHWRSAFLSYPALWSSFSFEDPEGEDSPSVAYVVEMERRTTIYLGRSKHHPLTLIVRMSSSFVAGLKVWEMLLLHSDRWKRLDLWISNESIMDGLVSRRGKMPILESLRLTMFEIASRFTLIHCEGERGWMFPWAQLTKLSINSRGLHFTHGVQGLRTFLLQLQNVEELRFLIPEEFDTLKCPPIRFARLRLLQTSFIYPGSFLCQFEAPLLEDLWVFCRPVSIRTFDLDKCNEELSFLAHQSHCHIRHLTLEDCEVEVAHSIMKALTSVEKLCINYWPVFLNHGPRLVQDIAKSNGIYLPKLRVLQMSCCPKCFERYVSPISYLFEVRNRQPRLAPASSEITSLKRLKVKVDWTSWDCCAGLGMKMKSRAIDDAFEAMCSWPSFFVTGLQITTSPSLWEPTLTVRASAAGALIHLTICYPYDSDIPQYYLEERRRHQSILENKFPSASIVFID